MHPMTHHRMGNVYRFGRATDVRDGISKVHYIFLTSRPLEDPTVVGWQERFSLTPPVEDP